MRDQARMGDGARGLRRMPHRPSARSGGKDVQKLLGYARELGVERKISNYLEVPL